MRKTRFNFQAHGFRIALVVGLLFCFIHVPIEAKRGRVDRDSEKARASAECHDEVGRASYYDEDLTTASRERFDPEAMTAAHPQWPMNSRLRVSNPSNGKSVEVRINDRGPFTGGRIIDLTRAAFAKIAPLKAGVIKVKIEVLSCGKRAVEKNSTGWFGSGDSEPPPVRDSGRD